MSIQVRVGEEGEVDLSVAAPKLDQPESRSVVNSATAPRPGGTNHPLLPEATLHGLPGDVVRSIDPHTEADPAAILVSYLVALGNVVGRKPYFAVESSKHHLNLFAVLVGDTAKARKGTSWDHIKRIFSLVEEQDAVHSRSRWQDSILSSLSSGEGLIWTVRDAEVIEGCADPGVTDKRRIVTDSEFAQTLAMLSRQGNTLSPVIRNAWDSGNLSINTKNNPATATAAHISIIGHITRAELKRQLTSTEIANGFANRFLWASVRRSKLLPDGGNLQRDDLNDIVTRTRKVIDEGCDFDQVKRSAEARHLWHAVYPELTESQEGILGSVTARAEAQVVRLSCLYAVADLSPEVRVEHLKAALGVWSYCAQSAQLIFGDGTGDRTADSLLEELRRIGNAGMSRTDIRDYLQRNKCKKEVNGILGALEDKRLAKCERKGRTEMWFAL